VVWVRSELFHSRVGSACSPTLAGISFISPKNPVDLGSNLEIFWGLFRGVVAAIHNLMYISSMKKVPLKIFLASSFTALFVACTATGDAVRSDEDNSSTISRLSIYDAVEESGLYTTKDSVAAYLCKFDKLPANYVGKDKGIALYESKTGNAFSKWNFNPWTTINVMIGGDKFSNNEGLLPEGSYHEADVDYSAKNRGTKRLVYQPDCVIYYTADHYETFTRMEVR